VQIRYKIIIEYDGTPYNGWQRQKRLSPKHKISVQEALENAISKYFNQQIELYVAGRTDVGVHATAQAAHFDAVSNERDENSIVQGINFYLLKEKIRVISAMQVEDSFNARTSAIQRIYHYKIVNRRATLALDENRAWHIPEKLDMQAMVQASKYLLGKHDFSSFRAKDCQAKHAIRSIDEINFSIPKEGEILVEIKAKSFLHHMVRNIMGTLYLAGKGKIPPQKIAEILQERDRTKAGITAPACGLYLMGVRY